MGKILPHLQHTTLNDGEHWQARQISSLPGRKVQNMAYFEDQIYELSERSRLLTGEHLLHKFKANPEIHYRKIDFLLKPGSWRSQTVTAAVEENLSGILVTGHGDRHLRFFEREVIRKSFPEIVVVWATNLRREDSFFHCLPLGLTNPVEDDGPLHKLFGDQSLIARALEEESFTEPAIYSNYASKTSPKHRRPLDRFLELSSYALFGAYDTSYVGRLTYLRQMRKHGFVVCPRGNGLDTHRFFEALCLGVIPILKSSEVPRWTRHLSTRSFVTVSSWSDLGKLNFADLMTSHQLPIPKELSESFWAEKILSSRLGTGE